MRTLRKGLLLAGLAALLHLSPAHAQQHPIKCSTSANCNFSSGPANTGTGYPLWQAFGFINNDLGELFNINGLMYGTNGGAPASILPGALGTYCLNWAISLADPPTTVTCPGGAIFQVNGTLLDSSTTINFENSAATDGLTIGFINPSSGNIQLTLSGSYSGSLASATGLPLGSITGFGTGVATFLATPSAANLGSAVTGASLVAGTNVTISGTWPNQTINASGGGGSLPSCTVDQLIYYASTGTTGSCLTLGTNLSITSGTLNATAGGGGVSSFTGDGSLISNSGSTGGVTVTLANTGVGYGVWGNTGSSSGAAGYHAMSSYPAAAFPTFPSTQISGLGTFATQNYATPPAIGATTPAAGAFTTLSATGQFTSTVNTGTPPFVVSSTTNVANLNASSLNGATFASPGPIGSTAPSTGAFSNLSASGALSGTAFSNYLLTPPPIGTTTPAAGAFTTLGVTSSGAASTPAQSWTGAPFAGGTGTTTVPLLYCNDGTAPSTWSTNGTEFGCNAPSSFLGNFFDMHVNGGASVFSVTYQGVISGIGTGLSGTASSLNIGGNAATATNLASYPALCTGGQFSQGLSSGSNNCATPSASASSITPGTTTVSGATAPCLIDNSTGTTMGCAAIGQTLALASNTLNTTAPQRTATSSPTVASTDMGGVIVSNVSGGGTLTIPAISSSVFPANTTLTVINYSTSTETVSSTPTVNSGGGCVTGTGIPAGATWELISNGTTIDCNQTVSTASGGMVYPGAGIPQSTGSAWGTSITPGTGVVTALGDAVNGTGGLLTYSIIGTSGATLGLLNTNNTFSGASVFSGSVAHTATSLPLQAAGTLGVAGETSTPTLGAAGEGDIYLLSTTGGLAFIGEGSTNDLSFFNKNGTSVCTVATGTTNWNCTGLEVGGTNVVTAGANSSITSLTGLTTALSAGQGGTGSSTVPSSAQIPVGNSGGTAYAPQTLSGDGSLTSAGVLKVTATNGTSFSVLATTVPGTGVAAALGDNIGSAGAPVVYGGAGGTPSSLTCTNCSGTAASLVAGSALVPERTVTSSPTVASTDMGGQIVANVSGGGTLTIPAISSSIFAANMALRVVNYSASTMAVSTTPTVNSGGGCASGTGIPSGDTWSMVSNGTTIDCSQTVNSSSGGGGGVTIGNAVSGGTANTLLYTNSGTDVANASSVPLGFTTTPIALTAVSSNFTPNLSGASSSNQFTLTLGSGDTIANPTGSIAGESFTLAISQPSSGGPYTVSWGAGYSWAAGSAPSLNTGANAVTLVNCEVITTTPTMVCYGPVNGAFLASTSAQNPSAPSSTSAFSAQGLSSGVTRFTPTTTGNMTITVSGSTACGTGTCTAATAGVEYYIMYGTGNGNANGSTTLGTTCGGTQEYRNGAAVTSGDGPNRPFSITCNVSGLTVGTAYYVDLAAEAVTTASSVALANVVISAQEAR